MRSVYKRATISPRKVAPTLKAVRKKNVNEAIKFLTFQNNKASRIIQRVIKDAVANATNNKSAKEEDLMILDIKLGPGPTRKWRRFAAKGRYKPIRKRTSNITVELSSKKEEKSE